MRLYLQNQDISRRTSEDTVTLFGLIRDVAFRTTYIRNTVRRECTGRRRWVGHNLHSGPKLGCTTFCWRRRWRRQRYTTKSRIRTVNEWSGRTILSPVSAPVIRDQTRLTVSPWCVVLTRGGSSLVFVHGFLIPSDDLPRPGFLARHQRRFLCFRIGKRGRFALLLGCRR